MITFTSGNLLDARAEALVNTVNTVGVMGKGIALMFKEAFPENFEAYQRACKAKQLQVGEMFVTERSSLLAGPRFIINFPTKSHWRFPSRIDWIERGLESLKGVIALHNITSVALPPLGAGNGGLPWPQVRERIVAALSDMDGVDVIVYEPTSTYQNVSKRDGVEKLTPARALITEIVRRYWTLGVECTLLEVQKLAYFLGRALEARDLKNELRLKFESGRYGPYAQNLNHLLNSLDGSYLHCERRIADAKPLSIVWADDTRASLVDEFLHIPSVEPYAQALDAVAAVVEGFESPMGIELLGTVDWLVHHQQVKLQLDSIKTALAAWPGGDGSGERKLRLFDDRMLLLAMDRLKTRGRAIDAETY